MCEILWGHFEKGNSHKKHFLKCLAMLFSLFSDRDTQQLSLEKKYLNKWQKSVYFYTMVIFYFFFPMICIEYHKENRIKKIGKN